MYIECLLETFFLIQPWKTSCIFFAFVAIVTISIYGFLLCFQFTSNCINEFGWALLFSHFFFVIVVSERKEIEQIMLCFVMDSTEISAFLMRKNYMFPTIFQGCCLLNEIWWSMCAISTTCFLFFFQEICSLVA